MARRDSLTLADLVDLSLRNSPDTRLAWENARASAAAYGSARGPAIHRSTARWGSPGCKTRPRRAASRCSRCCTSRASASTGWSSISAVGPAPSARHERRLLAADWTHNAVISDVVLRTARAYYDYIGFRALLAAQVTTLEEQKVNLAAAEDRRRVGVATIADVLQARTAVSQALLTVQTTEGVVRTARGALATAADFPATTDLDAEALIGRHGDIAEVADSVDTLVKHALDNRPDLAAAQATYAAAQQRTRVVKSARLPSISVAGAAGCNIILSTGGGGGNFYSLGFSLAVPLFNGFSWEYNTREAEALAEVESARTASLAQQVTYQVFAARTTGPSRGATPASRSRTAPRSPGRSPSSTAGRARSSSRSRTRRRRARSASSSRTTRRPASSPWPIPPGPRRLPYTIPAVSISQADGDALKPLVGQGLAVTVAREAAVQRRRHDRQPDRRARVGALPLEPSHRERERPGHEPVGAASARAGATSRAPPDGPGGGRALPGNAGFGGALSHGGYVLGGGDNGCVDNQAWYFGIRRYPYSTRPDEGSAHVQAHRERVAAPHDPAPIAFADDGQRERGGPQHGRGLGDDALGVLRGAPARYRAPDVRAGAGPDAALLRRVAQAHPVNPTLLEARDALLAAAFVADRDDHALFVRAFAKRGAGPRAVASPDRLRHDQRGSRGELRRRRRHRDRRRSRWTIRRSLRPRRPPRRGETGRPRRLASRTAASPGSPLRSSPITSTNPARLLSVRRDRERPDDRPDPVRRRSRCRSRSRPERAGSRASGSAHAAAIPR